MKEAVASEEEEEVAANAESCRLDMQGAHRVHVLFSGTNLLSVRSAEAEDGQLPASTPAGVCYV